MLKRFFDLIIAITCLVLLFPFLVFLTIILSIANRGNAFFTQKRVGKNNRVFTLIKYKTMNDATDNNGNLLPDKDRLTRAGRVVRNLSLDEFPQLLNVIKGDMSLIGPRPLLVKYLERYNAEQIRRHEVRPGITGWAQVNGRNDISWEQKFIYDVWYVDNQTFFLDIKILWITLVNVLHRKGINSSEDVTMQPFLGSK